MTNLYYRLRYWCIAAWCWCRGYSWGGGEWVDIRQLVAKAECDPHQRALLADARKKLREKIALSRGEKHDRG